LSKVLEQNEHVEALVKACAAELSSVHGALEQALATHDVLPGVRDALRRSAAMATRVQAASAALSVVNRALQGEFRDRNLVGLQFAAAQEQEQASRHAAFHDRLTGLPNRALFNDRLEHGIAQAQRHGWRLAVMFVDLDDFKAINDAHGHDAGDSVLQAIARRLNGIARGEDTVSRHGGDEFLYLLTKIGDDGTIGTLADKIIQTIQAPCNVSVREVEICASIGASIGISIFPKDGATGAALIKGADEAMYRAKQSKSGYAFAR
jgi:diguanylate cyclase (GGDEF)-like protein